MNEPVAWMCPTGLEYKQRATDFMYNDALYDKKLNWIPLYTHPVKELTDEEIDIALYVADITLDNLSDGDISMERIKAFVRTILRKAKE